MYKQFKIIRQKGWVEAVNSKILIINNTQDKVVSSKKIHEIHERLPNSEIITFDSTEHEIFMEKDVHRIILWRSIDQFLN